MMLDSHPSISCGPETLFLEQMLRAERINWKRLAAFGISEEQWHGRIRELFVWVHTQRAQRYGKDRWADKSPGYTLILDYIDSLFPDCQVVQVIRDPRDVIDSWTRRWGARRARAVVGSWPQHVRAGRSFGARHSPDRYCEIQYEQLVKDPEKTMRGLLDWLGEPWDASVLRFEEFDHGYSSRPLEDEESLARWAGDPLLEKVGSLPPQDPGTAPVGSAGGRRSSEIFSSSIGVGKGPMSTIYLAELRLRSGRLMRDLGYSRW
jgi:hypothetical protein